MEPTTIGKLLLEINTAFGAFAADANVSEGNKAAARRSRKASLSIERLMKEWRKESLAAERK